LLKGHPDQDFPVTLPKLNPPLQQGRRVGRYILFPEDFLICPQAARYRAVTAVDPKVQFLLFGWLCRLHLLILSVLVWHVRRRQ
jgi:hypothetical protein